MNWNGQRPWVDHIIAKRSDPRRAAQLQKDLDAFRLKRAIGAANVRPVYLPLQFDMTAAAQTSPYRDTTQSLGYDVVIIGIKTDTPGRDIILRRGATERSLARVGDETALYLSGSDIAGGTVLAGDGQQGIFYLPAPMPLPAGSRMTLEIFKTDATGGTEQANVVLVGLRVYQSGYADQLIDDAERSRIEKYISMREVPEPVMLKQLVDFDSASAGGAAINLYSPRVEEPLLIRGCRSTLQYSSIEVGLQGEPTWTTEATPVWAIAADPGNVHESYHWFPKAIYLHSHETIEIRRVVNSLNDSDIDSQTGNTITWLCETV